jgi:hypothetical protein
MKEEIRRKNSTAKQRLRTTNVQEKSGTGAGWWDTQ